MKTNTIKWRIFKYNLVVIFMLIAITTVVFNIAVKIYIEKEIFYELNRISTTTEYAALQHGSDFFNKSLEKVQQAPPSKKGDNLYRYYFMLNGTLKNALTVLNADFILLDKNKEMISPAQGSMQKDSKNIQEEITKEIKTRNNFKNGAYIKFKISGNEYVAIIKAVSDKNSFGLGWVIIYSSIQQVNRLQLCINIIFSVILILSALIMVIFSSVLSRKISAPFSSLNIHIRSIGERNFKSKIHMEVDDEFKNLVQNINYMSEKLELYDKAQKNFLQNVSHEFRTPLMSIRSYAEGIIYEVVEDKEAADIIIAETDRLTQLVENLLYLSRLNSLEESYIFSDLNLGHIINSVIDRLNIIAVKNNVKLSFKYKKINISADEEKLSRAISNIISNCIRYAKSIVTIDIKQEENNIKIVIMDDGPGVEQEVLQYIFERFYKGKNGKFGLGLAISKDIIEKHGGTIEARNLEEGIEFVVKLS